MNADKNPAQAERELLQILTDQAQLVASHPAVPDYRNALGRSLLEYSRSLQEKGELPKATLQLEKAVTHFEEALERDPGNRSYVMNLSDAYTLKMLIAMKEKKSDQVTALAEKLIGVPNANLSAYLAAAMGYTRCLVIAATDEDMTPENREKKSDKYGHRAVQILRKAFDQRLLNTPEPLRDEEFLPLRNRPDFIELFKELRDRQVPATG